MLRRFRILALALALLQLAGRTAAAQERHWLEGVWSGTVEKLNDKKHGPQRQLTVTAVQPGGIGVGEWGTSGDAASHADISVNGNEVRIVTVANTVVELTRRDDTLEGTFVTSHGRRYHVALKHGVTLPSRLELATARTLASVRPDSHVIVIAVGADDCPPCLFFARKQEKAWEASPLRKEVEYDHIWTATYRRVTEDYFWPVALRTYRDQVHLNPGAPQFLVGLDGRAVLRERGLDSWDQKVLPLVQKLIARKHSPQ